MSKSSQKRRVTISETKFPAVVEFSKLAQQWRADVSTTLLTFVWGAYDILKKEVLVGIDVKKTDADLEREISQLLEPRIRRLMSGDEPYFVQHGSYERERRQPPPAQPPQYDIAFVLNANPRVMWPLEAKLLRKSVTTSKYVQEIRANYLTCRSRLFRQKRPCSLIS